MGWLLEIYLLENITMIGILRFLRFGILHSNKDKIVGIIVGISKLDIRLTFGMLKMPVINEKGAGNA
mgnify:CR=1 FL=1|tara:strand:+ start:965 stop:1165 length:201 start_codon:yes stop_codon:yes gene_type:complete